MLLCFPKELLRKVPRVNLKSSLRSVGVAVKEDIHKPFLNPRSGAETGESNLAEDLLFCVGSEIALTSQKCEVKEQFLVIDSGASSHLFFDRPLFFNFSKETQRKIKNANWTTRKSRELENFLVYFWTKM